MTVTVSVIETARIGDAMIVAVDERHVVWQWPDGTDAAATTTGQITGTVSVLHAGQISVDAECVDAYLELAAVKQFDAVRSCAAAYIRGRRKQHKPTTMADALLHALKKRRVRHIPEYLASLTSLIKLAGSQ